VGDSTAAEVRGLGFRGEKFGREVRGLGFRGEGFRVWR
jgi:hypothetical protein